MVKHFDFIASQYDRFVGMPDVRLLRSLLQLPSTGWMLDVGGGTGRVAIHFLHLIGHLVVCDASLEMLKQSRCKADLVRMRAHAEKLPFKDEVFDRVLVVDALHHFSDQQRALANLFRVLKRGGRMVIEEPDIDRPVIKLIALFEKLALMESRFHSATSLCDMISQQGMYARTACKDKFRVWITVDK